MLADIDNFEATKIAPPISDGVAVGSDMLDRFAEGMEQHAAKVRRRIRPGRPPKAEGYLAEEIAIAFAKYVREPKSPGGGESLGPFGEIVLVVFDAIGVRNVDIQNACKAGIRLMERGKTRV